MKSEDVFGKSSNAIAEWASNVEFFGGNTECPGRVNVIVGTGSQYSGNARIQVLVPALDRTATDASMRREPVSGLHLLIKMSRSASKNRRRW